ncbi:MAG: cache domain-containing protein [Campylobacterota bacterium]|nr:cache domain-containing protein [Campylobacterota bacterium]
MKKPYQFILFYFIVFIMSFFILYNEKETKIDNFIANEVEHYTIVYNTIYHQYKQRADIIFQTKINKKEIIELFKKQDREGLHKALKDDYDSLNNFYLKQLHFHTKDNISFLRFHRPSKFGDDLSNIRPTIKYVNKTKKPIDGFEEGRIFNGYRQVYPLFDDGTHIGSVEISFSAYALVNEIMEHYKLSTNFLISKEVVEQKVFNSEKSNYMESIVDGFYFEKMIIQEIFDKDRAHRFLSKLNSKEITKKIYKKNPFAIYDKSLAKLVIFIPIQNPITKNVVASVMINKDVTYIMNKELNFKIVFVLFNIFMAILLYIAYKQLNLKNRFKKTLKILKEKKIYKEKLEQYEQIFHHTNNTFIIIDENETIVDLNNNFYNIFGYKIDDKIVGKSFDTMFKSNKKFDEFKERTDSNQSSIVNIEFELKKSDGQTIWCELSSKNSIYFKSKKYHKVWSITNINNRVLSEELIDRLNNKIKNLKGNE